MTQRKKRRVTKGLQTTHMHWRERILYLLVKAKMRGIALKHAEAWERWTKRNHHNDDWCERQADKLERSLIKHYDIHSNT